MELIESLKLIGPGRYCKRTTVEVHLEFSEEDIETVACAAPTLRQSVVDRLHALGIGGATLPELPGEESNGVVVYCKLLAATAVAVQQHAGFRITHHAGFRSGAPNCGCAVAEYDNGDAGLEAMRLAIVVMEQALPALSLPIADDAGPSPTSQQLLTKFLESAEARRLPDTTRDIIEAAEALDVPWVNLDRDPYEGVRGDFRILPNGMLKLGHACHQRVIDGTLPVDANPQLMALAHDRAAVRQVMKLLKLPLPPRLVVETQVGGATFKAILSNASLVAVVEFSHGNPVADVTADIPEQTVELLGRCARTLQCPLLVVTLVSTDITQALDQNGCVTSLDVAPDLARLLPGHALVNGREIRARAARGLVMHLFPEGKPARIPLVSVTGTNGKSTVCFMLSRLVRQAGFEVGCVSTTGRYLNDQQLESGDHAGGKSHFRLLESADIDFAVLETARGAVTGLGLAFDRCDVSVCTNITDDHLGQRGIETVEDMVELKWFITNLAARAVVLNADDPHCANLHSRFPDRAVWMVSQQLDAATLKQRFPTAQGFCITADRAGVEWIRLVSEAQDVDLLPVAEVPLTENGKARFNVCNTLQACAAAYLSGANQEQLREGLRLCHSNFRNNPGRMNFFDGLPFRVLFDFAHNEAGFEALCAFTNQLEVPGLRRIIITPRGDSTDEVLSALALAVAEGYDYFYCNEHPRSSQRAPGETPDLLAKSLLEHGVAKSRITVYEDESILEDVLDQCRPGDLLVATTTTIHLHEQWATLEKFKHRLQAKTEGKLDD